MADGRFRTTTVLVATKERTQLYGDIEEMSAAERQQLHNAIFSDLSATILIADRDGRAEIARLLREARVRRTERHALHRRERARFLLFASLTGVAILLGWATLTIYF